LSNEDLWEITKQEPIAAQIRKRKWCWIGHTLRKPEGSIERAALGWNSQGTRRGRPRKTWRRSIEEEIGKKGKTWREVKRLANDRTKWKNFISALCSKRSNRR
jgi:hypothetical protein